MGPILLMCIMKFVVYYRHRVHRIPQETHVEAASHEEAYDMVKSMVGDEYDVTHVYKVRP